jgi:uncharacterized protein (TIGR03083 family)
MVPAMGEMSEVYEAGRIRVRDMALSASQDELERKVPACPDWSVKDLFAHLVGVGEDTAGMNVGAAGSEEWTQSQIDRRRDLSAKEIDSEWEQLAPKIAGVLDAIPPGAGAALIGDLITHEIDMKGALGKREGPDDRGLLVALERYVKFFGKRVKDAGLPAVEVETWVTPNKGDGLRTQKPSWVAGVGEPALRLKADMLSLLRALTGRRTEEQIRKFEWSGDPTPYIPLVSNYGMPEEALPEWSGGVSFEL